MRFLFAVTPTKMQLHIFFHAPPITVKKSATQKATTTRQKIRLYYKFYSVMSIRIIQTIRTHTHKHYKNLLRDTAIHSMQGMTLATGPLARRRFSAAGPVGPQACIFYWPDGPLGNRSGHRWVWRTLARRRWWLCLQSPCKQQTVTSVLMGICHHGVAVRGFVWLCL